MTVGRLIAPDSDEEILDLEPEALSLKSVMTGDAFSGVRIGGEDTPLDVMVAGHPCTIRRGVRLVERVPCVRIIEHQQVPYDRWPTYDQTHFPIPAATDLGERRCAALWDWVGVPRTELLRSRRCMTLQDQGIYILLQRLIFSLSRFAPPISTLKEASQHVLAEAELEHTWLMDLYDGDDPDGEDVASLIEAFGTFMSANDRRSTLRTDRRRVTTDIEQEILQRRAHS